MSTPITADLEDPLKENHRFLRWFLTCTFIFQFGILGFTYAYTPGYIIPILNHKIAFAVWLALYAWELVGVWILFRSQSASKANFQFLCSVFIAVCFMPVDSYPCVITGPPVIYDFIHDFSFLRK